MGSFPPPAGVRVVDESLVQDRLDDVTNRMVYHAIAEGRRLDDALFRVRHDELAVTAVFICLMREFEAQREQIFFKFVAELQNRTPVAFTGTGAEICGVEIGNTGDLFKQTTLTCRYRECQYRSILLRYVKQI